VPAWAHPHPPARISACPSACPSLPCAYQCLPKLSCCLDRSRQWSAPSGTHSQGPLKSKVVVLSLRACHTATLPWERGCHAGPCVALPPSSLLYGVWALVLRFVPSCPLLQARTGTCTWRSWPPADNPFCLLSPPASCRLTSTSLR